jgi:hypothetical protein
MFSNENIFVKDNIKHIPFQIDKHIPFQIYINKKRTKTN